MAATARGGLLRSIFVEASNALVWRCDIWCYWVGASLVPFVAGFLLSVRDALIATLYAACVAVILAGLGSGSLFGWDAITFCTYAYRFELQ